MNQRFELYSRWDGIANKKSAKMRTPEIARNGGLLMRLSIAAKLSLSATLLVIIVTFVTVRLLYSNANATLTEHELIDLQDETALRGRELLASLDQLRADLLFIGGSSASRAVLLAHVQQPEPPPGISDDERNAADPFVILAKKLLMERNFYTSIRYIRNDEKKSEIVSVQRINDVHVGVVASPRTWGNDEDVQYAIHTGPQVVSFSDVRVTPRRTEYGYYELDLTATVPVHYSDPKRGVYGVVVVNIDFSRLIERFKRSSRHLIYLADDKGRLLIHPDFLKIDDDPDPIKVSDDPELQAVVEKADENRQPSNAGLCTSLISRTTYHLPRHGFWLVSSKRVPDSVDRRKLESHLLALAQKNPDVKIGRIDPNGRVVYVSSQHQDRVQAILDQIQPPSSSGVSDVFGGENRIQWNAMLRCENFAFQHVELALNSIDETISQGTARHDFPPHQNSFGLTIAVSMEEIESDISRDFRRVLNVILGLGVGVAILAFLLSMLLIRPLKRMTAAAEQIADGKTADITVSKTRTDEIGALARAFHHMAVQVDQRSLALTNSEAQVRAILDAAADGILTLDQQGLIQSFNPAAQLLFGYTQDEVIGKHYRILVPRESSLTDGDDVLTTASRSFSLERGVGVRRELTGRRRDESMFQAEISISAVATGDTHTYTVVLRDITERKIAEQQIRLMNEQLESRVQERTAELLEANHTLEQARDAALEGSRAKDAFLRNMSHELRTPLNVIDGYTRDLMEDAQDDDTKQVLGNIARASAHLIEVIEDILDMGKIEAGKLDLLPEEFRLQPLIEQVGEMFVPLMRTKSNQFELKCQGDLGTVRLDRKRVKQVLLNLLGNANKFTDRGRITLQVFRTPQGDQDWLEFRVIDTGRGMKQDEVKRLFQPFYQADSSTTRKHQGTGLGLAISRRLCNLMGGDISVTSDFGNGSVFTIRIPARLREGEIRPTVSRTPPRVETPAQTTGNLIIVIDDDPSTRDLMERFLGKEGYHIRTAATGEEGLALVREARPLAIVLDALLPGIDGWAVLAALKSDPKTAGIPIIMATILDDAKRGYALGATDYITKPVDWQRLSYLLSAHRIHQGTAPVLVIEDDVTTREMIVRMLKRQGWRTLEASNGREGLQRLEQETPALVLLDLMMPEMDGFEFVQAIREQPKWALLPVVVVTAADLTDIDRTRLNGRVEQILRKGAYSPEALLEEVRQQVERCAKETLG